MAMKTYRGLETLEVPTRDGGKVKLAEFRLLDGYYSLTTLTRKVKFNRHNFNRRSLVKQCKEKGVEIDNNRVFIVNEGGFGQTKVHPILMPTVIREISIELYMELEQIILDKWDT